MKVKSHFLPRILVATWAILRTVLRGTWLLFARSKMFAFSVLLLAVAVGLFIFRYDMKLLETVHFFPGSRTELARSIAWYLSTYGDYLTYNLPLAVFIWIYGAVTKNIHWCRVAVICFLGASFAGLFDDFFRLSLGRARPDSHVAPGFYGISRAFQGGYQSFPSGHAAAVFGTAMALIVTEFPLGVLTTIFALGVVWARMQLYRHYPSDVAVGSIIGIYFGLLVGWGAKFPRTPRSPGAEAQKT